MKQSDRETGVGVADRNLLLEPPVEVVFSSRLGEQRLEMLPETVEVFTAPPRLEDQWRDERLDLFVAGGRRYFVFCEIALANHRHPPRRRKRGESKR